MGFLIRQNFSGAIFTLLLLLASVTVGRAEDKKEKPEPPSLLVASPLGAMIGAANLIKLRGLNLTNVTELRAVGAASTVQIELKGTSKVDVPKQQESKKAGDTQLEVKLVISSSTPSGILRLVAVSRDGESKPYSMPMLASASEEIEPNGAFLKPQSIGIPATIRGSIQEAMDVDVFRFHAALGESISIEVVAARFGSSLDSIVTIYDSKGHILAVNDDAESLVDSKLRFEVPASGNYFIVLNDAHDRGGAAHGYNLIVERVMLVERAEHGF